jgi:hypothetical protein
MLLLIVLSVLAHQGSKHDNVYSSCTILTVDTSADVYIIW